MAQEAFIDGNLINDDRPLAVEAQANTGVDIGDVTVNNAAGAAAVNIQDGGNTITVDGAVTTTGTVALTNDSIVGPGDPVIDSYATAVVNLAASGANQVLIAAPGANKQIWVYGCIMIGDTADGTVTIQDEDDVALTGTMVVNDGAGFVIAPSGNFSMPWIKTATGKALEADTGACTVDGIITYAVVSV